MKSKLFIVPFVIACLSMGMVMGCNSDHTHSYKATDEVDENGNIVYACDCGDVHEHTYNETWMKNATTHYRTCTCELSHIGYTPRLSEGEHEFDDDYVCTICGYEEDQSEVNEYELNFSYYRYDSSGTVETDEDYGSYIEVGVEYTSYESSSGLSVDIDGDSVVTGDVIKFGVYKSVYCYYTDGDRPYVYANQEAVNEYEYDSEKGIYVYSLTITDDIVENGTDIIIWVGNVLTKGESITGSGTEDDPLMINSETDWLYFAEYINDSYYNAYFTYNSLYWALGCDLDFQGEETYIIGDGYSATYAIFAGNFNGNGHTISNFVISNEISESSDYSNYLGLFGACSAASGVSAVIQNLTIKNATITATAPSDGVAVCGGIAGYALGYNFINCRVEDVTIEVIGNTSYYSYMGGIVGLTQSYLDEDNDIAYYASIQYCSVSNTTLTGTGYIYAAGGIAGYVAPNDESAPVFVINSYIENGTLVSGGMHSGGVVGFACRYTSIENCYAACCEVVARNESTSTSFRDESELDARYAYAGGIVGYAENDTFVGYCFIDQLTISASSTNYSSCISTGDICGGASVAGYEDYYAEAVSLVGNVSGGYSSSLNWSSADWDFSGSYPTTNQEEVERTFYVTIVIDGESYDSVAMSAYYSTSYWYLLGDLEDYDGISIYVRSDETSRTYGYYFDEALTMRIPTCYVPVNNITYYASYVDCSELLDHVYYVTGNGVTAQLTFYANGIYSYEEGAVYVTGNYEYDGNLIKFKDSYFARLASGSDSDGNEVTSAMQATYYTFYATINSNGDLEIFDCDSILYDVYTDYEYLARFYPVSSPLKAVHEKNLTFVDSYYNESGNELILGYDYTGTIYYSGAWYDLTYAVDDLGAISTITFDSNDYAVTTVDGKITTLTRTVGNRVVTISFTPYDSFYGTWSYGNLYEKTYTFDGKGGYTYTTPTTSTSGTYTLSNDVLTIIENGTTITIIISDGTLIVERDDAANEVTYFASNSFTGTWYTYSYKVNRYTMILSGINASGYGDATFMGTDGFRYTYVDGEIELYYDDMLYAVMVCEDGVMYAYVYDSDTDDYDILYTFYLYDNYTGSWVSDIDGITTLTFGGFGYYNIEEDGSYRAVYGTLTINGESGYTYSVSKTTGIATFEYNGVTYTLEYDEFNNTISVSYGTSTAVIAEQDIFADVVLVDENGATYSFDGRGNMQAGGIVTYTDETGTYTYTYFADGSNIVIQTKGATVTIEIVDGKYTMDGMLFTVQNAFTGTWAVQKGYASLVIGDIYSIVVDESIEVEGEYNGVAVTLTYDGSVMSFEYDGTTYYVTAFSGYLVMSQTYDYTEDSFVYLTSPDAVFGTWTSGNITLKFDGTTTYQSNGNVTITYADGTTNTGLYTLSGNTLKIVIGSQVTVEFSESGFTYNGNYYTKA